MDFGCGTGLVSMFLWEKIKSITAVDTSEGMLTKLREKIEKERVTNITPVQADLTKARLNGTYDLIFSSMAFHHIQNTQALLKTMYTMLNPGGMAAIADLESEDGSFHSADTEIAHAGFEKEDIQRQFEQAGFAEAECKTVYVIPGAIRGSQRDYPVFLATGKKR